MELFVVLTGFWVLFPSIVALVLMLIWVANETSGLYPTLTLIGFVVALQLLGHIPIWQFIVAHPIWTLVYIAAYFILGFPYSAFELNRLCRRVSEEYRTAKQAFIAHWGPKSEIDGTAEEAWVKKCPWEFAQFRNGEFSISSYKGKILAWMMYWPWYLLWRLVHDLIKEIWELIYAQFQAIYQRIADRYYADILRDFKRSPNEPENK